MQKTPKALLEGAQRLTRDMDAAQAFAHSNGDFVWMKMNEAKAKLKQLKSALEALSKAL